MRNGFRRAWRFVVIGREDLAPLHNPQLTVEVGDGVRRVKDHGKYPVSNELLGRFGAGRPSYSQGCTLALARLNFNRWRRPQYLLTRGCFRPQKSSSRRTTYGARLIFDAS